MASRSSSRKSAREKLEARKEFEIVEIPPEGRQRVGGETMLIPRPLDVDALMRLVPKGKLATMNQIRARLAREHGAETTCPLTTGIFARLAAEAAEEDRARGAKQITPYWRTVKNDGSLNEKFPGGVKAQADCLKAEGHTIAPAIGKRPPKVKDFEAKQVKW